MFTITKEFAFSASHQLGGLPDDHPCSRLHGHNYVVEVDVSGQPGPVGFVVDYHALAGIKRYLDDTFDHQHLNDRMPGNPSAEAMAALIGDLAPGLIQRELHAGGWEAGEWWVSAVRVRETPKTCAEYRP